MPYCLSACACIQTFKHKTHTHKQIRKRGMCVCIYIPGSAAELIELATVGEDDDGNLSITKD